MNTSKGAKSEYRTHIEVSSASTNHEDIVEFGTFHSVLSVKR